MTMFASPLAPNGPAARFDAAYTAWNTVATYDEHADARRAVEHLADVGFPIEHVDIVGSDMRLVERVTGRLSRGRAASTGARNGVWLGMFVGVLIGIAVGSLWAGLVLGVVLMAAWGAALGFISVGRARGYGSTRELVALRYDLVVRGGHAEGARRALDDAGMRG